MSARPMLALLFFAGWGGFDYSATIGWNPTEDPEIVSVTVDGQPDVEGYVFQRSYDSFADAEQEPIAVEVTTTTGTMSFTFVPTTCGTFCSTPTMPSGGGHACSDLTSAQDEWSLGNPLAFEHQVSPLELSADGGECDDGGETTAWSTRVAP